MAESDASSTTGPRSQTERLTDQFYAWERRGRGWKTWPHLVDLEPPFRPFSYHKLPGLTVSDDGRKPTALSAFADRLRARLFGTLDSDDQAQDDFEIEEPEAESFEENTPLVEVAVSVPSNEVIHREAAEQFLVNLSLCPGPLSYELIGTPQSTLVQFACHQPSLPALSRQLTAHFPNAVLTPTNSLSTLLSRRANDDAHVFVEFGLSHEFMLPIRLAKSFDPDPLVGMVGALSDVQEGELAVLQILFQATRQSWAQSVRHAVTDGSGGSFFIDSPEFVSLSKEKVSRPLFACALRVMTQSPSPERAWHLAQMVGASLMQFASPASNEFIPLSNDSSVDSDSRKLVLSRSTNRSGMLLNCSELASIVHLPSASVRDARLRRELRKTKAAPSAVTGHSLRLGENCHAGNTIPVTLTKEQRLRHTYVIGASGTGKSTLLLNMVAQDLETGEGIAVLDPHGDLIDDILGRMPENRLGDVILMDASDAEFPIGFNILSAHSELEQDLLASDLVGIFRRLSTSWGDQMTSVLGNAVLAFLESTEGGTLSDLRRFLVEKEFREQFLTTVRDREVVYYWQKEFPLLVGRPQAPLLTRLDAFLRPKTIRRMVSQKENRINFRAIMDEKKVFLVKLSQGAIGEENAYLLGSLLVSRFHQTVMSRQEAHEQERQDFYLYIDEFQNFITPSMATILSAARKYHLGLILAHQELRQLAARNEDVASAVLANPATRICFRVGDQDAKRLESGFSFFEARDLQNLGVGEAICRIDRAEYDFNLKTSPALRVDSALASERRKHVTVLSQRKYGQPVEAPQADSIQPAHPPNPIHHDTEKIQLSEKRPREAAVPSARKPIPPASRAYVPSPTPGRGGPQHKYLQELIKRWAESKGFRATIEKSILDGMGSVDVALEKGDTTVACEISVTTTAVHEIGNLQKCLAAGFTYVVQIATNRKVLTALARCAQQLNAEERGRIQFLLPEELFAFLEERTFVAESGESAVRGYKVKVRFKSVGSEEQKLRKQAIAQTIFGAMRKIKGK